MVRYGLVWGKKVEAMNSPRTVLNERDTRRGGGEEKPGIPLNCRNHLLLDLLALTAV